MPPGDTLTEQAVWLVVMHRFASVGYLRTALDDVDTATAERLLDELRRLEVVDPMPGLPAPCVLVPSAALPALLERIRTEAGR